MLEQNIKDAYMMVETLIKDYFQRQNVQTHSETAFNTVESKQPRFSRWILAKFLNFFFQLLTIGLIITIFVSATAKLISEIEKRDQ